MTIKVFRIVEATEKGDNLLGYGFADDRFCSLRLGSKTLTYVSDDIDPTKCTMVIMSKAEIEELKKTPAWKPASAFDKMVQEQTDDIRGYRVEYQEYDLGDTPFVFGKEDKKELPHDWERRMYTDKIKANLRSERADLSDALYIEPDMNEVHSNS